MRVFPIRGGTFIKKKSKWLKFRHKVIVALLRPTFGLYVRLKYRIKIEKFKQEGKRPYLIIMNHQTAFDQFFVGLTFHRPVYYIASEDLFSMGWVSDLIRYLVAPIPIKKQTMDINAVKTCIQVARDGGTICLAPEGNRTFHGKTLYIKPGIASLVKKLGLPLAIFRIEGGYGVHPRWSDVVRKGKMRSFVSRVVEPEEYKDMSTQELLELIEQELSVDEGQVSGEFIHKKNAEFLERAIYTCPTCGFAKWESCNDIMKCTGCGKQVRHLPTKELEGVDEPFPHRFVAGWYEWQEQYINTTDLRNLTQAPVFTDRVKVLLVHPYKNKELLHKSVPLQLYGDRITLGDAVFPFAQLNAVVVLGKNKLNLYTSDRLLQLQGDKRFNALKYVHFYHRYQNLTTGDEYGKFLGL